MAIFCVCPWSATVRTLLLALYAPPRFGALLFTCIAAFDGLGASLSQPGSSGGLARSALQWEDDATCVTMSPMKEKPVRTKHAKPPRGDATDKDGKREDAEPRSDTRRRVRKIVERHRETFDELAK